MVTRLVSHLSHDTMVTQTGVSPLTWYHGNQTSVSPLTWYHGNTHDTMVTQTSVSPPHTSCEGGSVETLRLSSQREQETCLGKASRVAAFLLHTGGVWSYVGPLSLLQTYLTWGCTFGWVSWPVWITAWGSVYCLEVAAVQNQSVVSSSSSQVYRSWPVDWEGGERRN